MAGNQGSLDTGGIAKCPRRFVAVDQRWRIIEGLLYLESDEKEMEICSGKIMSGKFLFSSSLNFFLYFVRQYLVTAALNHSGKDILWCIELRNTPTNDVMNGAMSSL